MEITDLQRTLLVVLVLGACHAGPGAAGQQAATILTLGGQRIALGGSALPALPPSDTSSTYRYPRVLEYDTIDSALPFSKVVLYLNDRDQIAAARLTLRADVPFQTRLRQLQRQLGPGTEGKGRELGCQVWANARASTALCAWPINHDAGTLEFWADSTFHGAA